MKTFRFTRTVLDCETATIEADTLEEAVELLHAGEWEGDCEPIESWPWEDVEELENGTVVAVPPFPDKQELAASHHSYQCLQACHGLDLPDEVTPGLLADLVTAARDTLSASDARDLDSLANASQALRAILAKLTPIPGNISENKVDWLPVSP